MTITRIGRGHWIKRGERIEKARKFAGLTQEQLAERVTELLGYEVGRQVIYNIEKAKRPTSVDELRAIAAALDQSEDWLDVAETGRFNATPIILGLLVITWNDGEEAHNPVGDWFPRPIDIAAVEETLVAAA